MMDVRQTKWHEDIFVGLIFTALYLTLLLNGFSYLTSFFIVEGEIINGPSKSKAIVGFTSLIEQSIWKYPIVVFFAFISYLEFKKGYLKFKIERNMQVQKPNNIELFHSYEEFPKDVINVFSAIIHDFDFKVITQNITQVIVVNKHVELNFSMDRYDLMVILFSKNIHSRKRFGIIELLEIVNPDWKSCTQLHPVKHHKYGERATDTLQWYESVISNHLTKVINGETRLDT